MASVGSSMSFPSPTPTTSRFEQPRLHNQLDNTRIRKFIPRNRGQASLIHYLTTRTWAPYSNVNVAEIARNYPPFLQRLDLMKKLPVHDGCVNTIRWNNTGEYLLSGSDDRNLCITKPSYLFDTSEDYTVLHKVPTRHLGNIFSAKFIPNSGDKQLVSCSSEGPVIVHDINSNDPSKGLFNFNCHAKTIYEVLTVPDDDKLILSCSDDTTIRLYDLRVHTSCARSGTCPHPALIKNSHAITTINLHPLNSNLLLVGRTDGVGLVYDRRQLSSETRFRHPLDGVISQFSVPDMSERCQFTSLCYNKDGTEVLASYSGDYVYLFNHNKSSEFELIQTLPKGSPAQNDSSEGKSRESAQQASGISRIRMRCGSDTGPRFRRTNPSSSDNASNQSSNSLLEQVIGNMSQRFGERSRFIPITDLLNSHIVARANSSSGSTNHVAQNLNDEEVEEESNDNNDDEYDDEHDDDNMTIVDEDEDTDSMDDYENFTEITVESLIDDSRSDGTESSERNRSGQVDGDEQTSEDLDSVESDKRDGAHISSKTKANFILKAVDDLKSRYSQIPTYVPRVKYQGHRNCRTSIKESTFWGDDYVMSGSDCGRIIIWDKASANIVMAFPADERVVNCLAPNPYHYVLASSGIDYDIKLWSTQSLKDGPLKVNDEQMKRIVENNELLLEESKHTFSVPPHLFFRVLASMVHPSR